MLLNQRMKTLIILRESQVIPKKADLPPFSGDFISPRTGLSAFPPPHKPQQLLSPPAFFLYAPTLNTDRGTLHGCSSLSQADGPQEVWESLLTSTVWAAGHPK